MYIHKGIDRFIDFEWDERKNSLNQRKHGISFETAVLVFDDPLYATVQDREVEGEARWQTIGYAGDQMLLLVVAHTVREDGGEEVVRIISARKAKGYERRGYERAAS